MTGKAGRFIYAAGEATRDMLLQNGYTMLKQNETAHIYIFLNKDQNVFTDADTVFTLSDTLSF